MNFEPFSFLDVQNRTLEHTGSNFLCTLAFGVRVFRMYLLSLSYNVLCRSQRPRGLRRGFAAAHVPPAARMFISCECRLLSGRGLCVGLITRPEESYQLPCVQ
jgi:hypothetical protein